MFLRNTVKKYSNYCFFLIIIRKNISNNIRSRNPANVERRILLKSRMGRLGKGTLAVISSVLKGYFSRGSLRVIYHEGYGGFFIKEAHRESFSH